ncbi:MAG: ImmA/IrrE family metallo-endopeptidase [Pseudomonadota bacterium]
MPHATRVAGFRTWLKLDRQVKKGEKAIRILAPSPRKFTAQVEKQNPNTGEVSVEQEERSYMRYRAVPVFDISQTDGEDLPSLTSELQGNADEDLMAQDLFNRLEAHAFKAGFCVEVRHISGAANGYMDPSSRVLAVEQDLPVLHRAKTLAHECAHMVLHADLDAKLEHNSRSQQEVEAESVAFCLMKAFGLDSSLCSFGYVAGWSNGDPDKVTEAGQNIHKAFHQLLDATAPSTDQDLDKAA